MTRWYNRPNLPASCNAYDATHGSNLQILEALRQCGSTCPTLKVNIGTSTRGARLRLLSYPCPPSFPLFFYTKTHCGCRYTNSRICWGRFGRGGNCRIDLRNFHGGLLNGCLDRGRLYHWRRLRPSTDLLHKVRWHEAGKIILA